MVRNFLEQPITVDTKLLDTMASEAEGLIRQSRRDHPQATENEHFLTAIKMIFADHRIGMSGPESDRRTQRSLWMKRIKKHLAIEASRKKKSKESKQGSQLADAKRRQQVDERRAGDTWKESDIEY